MGLIKATAARYAEAVRQLLPPGRWNHDPDSKLTGWLLATGDELERVNQRGADLIEEADARTTVELLPEFERMLELASTGTDAERQARIASSLTELQRVRPVDFAQVTSAPLGLDPIDVVVIERDRAFAILVGDDTAIFVFFVFRDPALPGSFSIEDAQESVTRMQPSHTLGFVIESVSFRCDDPESLCDRDILESGPHDALEDELGISFDYLWPGLSRDSVVKEQLLLTGSATEAVRDDALVAGNGITQRIFEFPPGTNAWTAPDATAGSLASGATLFLYLFRLNAVPPANRCMWAKATFSTGVQAFVNSIGVLQVNLEAGTTVFIGKGAGYNDGALHVLAVVVDLVDSEFIVGTDLSASASIATPVGSVDSVTALSIGAGLSDSLDQHAALMAVATGSAVQALTTGTLDTLVANTMAAIVV